MVSGSLAIHPNLSGLQMHELRGEQGRSCFRKAESAVSVLACSPQQFPEHSVPSASRGSCCPLAPAQHQGYPGLPPEPVQLWGRRQAAAPQLPRPGGLLCEQSPGTSALLRMQQVQALLGILLVPGAQQLVLDDAAACPGALPGFCG